MLFFFFFFFRETKVRACQNESCEQPPAAAENVNARRHCLCVPLTFFFSDRVARCFRSAALVSHKQEVRRREKQCGCGYLFILRTPRLSCGQHRCWRRETQVLLLLLLQSSRESLPRRTGNALDNKSTQNELVNFECSVVATGERGSVTK